MTLSIDTHTASGISRDPITAREVYPKHFTSVKYKHLFCVMLSKLSVKRSVKNFFKRKMQSLRKQQISGLVARYGREITDQVLKETSKSAIFEKSTFRRFIQEVENQAVQKAILLSQESAKDEQQSRAAMDTQEKRALTASLLSATQEELERFAQTNWPEPSCSDRTIWLRHAKLLASDLCLKHGKIPTESELTECLVLASDQLDHPETILKTAVDNLIALNIQGNFDSDPIRALPTIIDAIDLQMSKNALQHQTGADDNMNQAINSLEAIWDNYTSEQLIKLYTFLTTHPATRSISILLGGNAFLFNALNDFSEAQDLEDTSFRNLAQAAGQHQTALQALTTSLENTLSKNKLSENNEQKSWIKSQSESTDCGNPGVLSESHWTAFCDSILMRSGIDIYFIRKPDQAIVLSKSGQFGITDLKNLWTEPQKIREDSQLSDQFHLDIGRMSCTVNGAHLKGTGIQRVATYKQILIEKSGLAKAISRLTHQAALAIAEGSIQELIGPHGRHEGKSYFDIQVGPKQTKIQVNHEANIKILAGDKIIELDKSLSFLSYAFTITLGHDENGENPELLTPNPTVDYKIHIVKSPSPAA